MLKTKFEYNRKAKVIFNTKTGLKIRMAEDDFDYIKSVTPELVDVKITDWCGYGCNSCYQGSTEEGKHGDVNYIYDIIDILDRCNTFEIAYGGGEPVHHPEFINIIEYTKMRGIVPNFTTFGTDWLDNQVIVAAVKDFVGGIGVSVYSKNSMHKYHKIKEAMKGTTVVVGVQHVVGMFPYKTTYDVVKAADRILLLGYKTTGRGKNKIPNQFTDEQIIELLSFKNKLISVDTAFLDNYSHVLDKMGIDKKLRTSPEGKFSCYIDAVSRTIGQSSYVEPEEMIPFDSLDTLNRKYDNFVKIYKEF